MNIRTRRLSYQTLEERRLAADGLAILDRFGEGIQRVVWQADSDQTIYVGIRRGNTFIGGEIPYELIIQHLADISDADTLSESIRVAAPSTTTRRDDGISRLDWFSFLTEPNTSYVIEVGGANQLRLFNADETQLQRDENSLPQVVAEGIDSEVLYVELRNRANYELRISDYSDDHGNRTATATEVGHFSTTAGLLEVRSDVDYFSFSALAGVTYAVEAASHTSLRILHENGETELAIAADGQRCGR